MSPSTWTISELAREFDVTPRTIRFYEDQGIVSPAREGRNRIFGPRDRTRLKLALRGKRLGLQLSEILTLIDMYDGPGDTEVQLRQYLAVLAQHRATLEQQRRDIEDTLQEIAVQERQCHELLAQQRS
ncbi:MerR family DNA-binding transcriptional regulator [Achromobacter xylosoxidans]|jgi:DNA-binding transcriptional MerR regulator|uniref:MerR family DNA-binding transcriptional regulator n=1 Tax=Alcaligenes xylosoxydans xylosoxydans TaxID=85698 RepID=A0A0D6FFG9_ALCXX|nr:MULTISPECIES: MerR family DNA-binding transcriptional regulator [Achromobacter]AHC44593.1 putative transcriptional regulator LiuR of leucine degradation pathway, MerR family [Achromobacter xylosoxidans NBRC 15126 = ATCC 27061]AMH05646.1 MerR family DNA-binding transcriptional regulator [Achromobacter xylosoxidans]AXA75106.1 MerR family DNA-binding transcriptional regulator [Achromobacter xylosoxidans]EFV84782.1 MerR-family transcriptional regulator [Achromobacter xylosoxidans C54]KMJ89770.1